MGKLITGSWGHLFASDKSERMTCIVLDVESQKLVAAQVQRDRATDSFTTASRDEMADLQDSLVNANGELFDNPAGYGLSLCDSLPSWAVPAAAPDKYLHCQPCNGTGLDSRDAFTSCTPCQGQGGRHNPALFTRKD